MRPGRRRFSEANIGALTNMVDSGGAALAAAMSAAPSAGDSLQRAQQLVAELRDIDQQLADLADRKRALDERSLAIRTKNLVDLLSQIGVKKLTVEAAGNAPPYTAELKPYYKANIAADWDDERRQRAFDWLEQNGDGDIIKRVITVELGRGSEKKAAAVRKALTKLKVDEFVSEKMDVPWGTLTAWLKEQIEKRGRVVPLETLGASVGQVVKVEPAKEAKK